MVFRIALLEAHTDMNQSEDTSKIDALARLIDQEDTPATEADESAESRTKFADLGLSPALVRALADAGYEYPTAVQVEAIPAAMNNEDLKVASSTGSGKTAAFMLPALERIVAARGEGKRREKGMIHGPRVLVLAPTRELALQVAKAAQTYGRHLQGLRVATVVGGVPYGAQLKALRGPLDVLIATPGRLLDHLGTGACVLSNLEVLVLDEADRMLDMGFIEDIESIAAQTPAERQTLMFSATFAGHVGSLAQRLTRATARSIDIASHTDRHDNIEQRLHYADHLGHKNELLDRILTDRDVDQAVIFTSTQRDADVLADRLADMGHAVAALHGGMPQGRRNRVLQALRQRQLRVLVATDVAARGIDVPTITHVINYGMPMKPEDYVHRIGRTGRAGRSGLAVTIAERRDVPMLRRIERYTTQQLPVATIEGLEPKMQPAPDRQRFGRGKPMPGQRHRDDRFGGQSRGFGGPRQDRDEGGYRGGHHHHPDHAAQGHRAPRDDMPFRSNERGDRPSFEGERSDHHPRRDERHGGYGAKAGFGGKPGFGEKRHGGQDKPGFGGKPSFGDKPRFGDKQSFGDKPRFGDKPSFGDKPRFGGDKPRFGDKPGFGGKRHTGAPKRQG